MKNGLFCQTGRVLLCGCELRTVRSMLFAFFGAAHVMAGDICSRSANTLLGGITPSVESISGDVAVLSGGTTDLAVTVQAEGNFHLQWYLGEAGDLSRPIPGVTGTVYCAGPIYADTHYWVKVSDGNGESFCAIRVLIGHPVSTLADLRKIGSGEDGWTLDSGYLLMNDIDASETWPGWATDRSEWLSRRESWDRFRRGRSVILLRFWYGGWFLHAPAEKFMAHWFRRRCRAGLLLGYGRDGHF